MRQKVNLNNVLVEITCSKGKVVPVL